MFLKYKGQLCSYNSTLNEMLTKHYTNKWNSKYNQKEKEFNYRNIIYLVVESSDARLIKILIILKSKCSIQREEKIERNVYFDLFLFSFFMFLKDTLFKLFQKLSAFWKGMAAHKATHGVGCEEEVAQCHDPPLFRT